MPSSDIPTRAPDTGPPRRVLVVDDEPSIVDAVATVLRYEGFEVEEASTGRAGLQSVKSSPSTQSILDVMLPDLDGFEVTRRLRADGIAVPVLFLTARNEVEDRVAGLGLGGDDYVSKPFSLVEIVARTKASGAPPARRRAGSSSQVRRRRDGRGEPRGVAEVVSRSSSRPPSSACCACSC